MGDLVQRENPQIRAAWEWGQEHQKLAISAKWSKIGPMWLWRTNRKSHTRHRAVLSAIARHLWGTSTHSVRDISVSSYGALRHLLPFDFILPFFLDFRLINVYAWMFDVLVCPLSVTERFLSQPLVCATVFHHTSLLSPLSPSSAVVLNHISSHFLIPLSDSSLICTVSGQWLVILDTIYIRLFVKLLLLLHFSNCLIFLGHFRAAQTLTDSVWFPIQ